MVTGSQEAKTYLAGLYNFSVKELEVFQIVFIDDKYAWLLTFLNLKMKQTRATLVPPLKSLPPSKDQASLSSFDEYNGIRPLPKTASEKPQIIEVSLVSSRKNYSVKSKQEMSP